MLEKYLPWSLSGFGPLLNTYGDLLFRSVRKTPPMGTNPNAAVGVHSIVPHRSVYAYLVAIKSFLRYYAGVAVFVHDDGSLTGEDRQLIQTHIRGARVVDRTEATERFDREVNDPFLSRVRNSYTSYLKLFDPSFLIGSERIILLDTDTLFLKPPSAVIEWARKGGPPWYHLAPRGEMKKNKASVARRSKPREAHIQTLIMRDLDAVNKALAQTYKIEQGFCAGFVGYEVGTVDFRKLKSLLEVLYAMFGDRIFRWGAEQTIHGLMLCSDNARALPSEDYLVFTRRNANRVDQASFVHFIGESRFYRMRYPRLALGVIRELRSVKP